MKLVSLFVACALVLCAQTKEYVYRTTPEGELKVQRIPAGRVEGIG